MTHFTLYLLFLVLVPSWLPAQEKPGPETVLRQYFGPKAAIIRERLFLSGEQRQHIAQRSRTALPSTIITYFRVTVGDSLIGYGVLESAVVRTMPATYMVIIGPDTTIRAIELVAFTEPDDYRPSVRWLDQFRGMPLTDELWMKRGIQNMVGATLSAHVLTGGARRALALISVLPRKSGP